jgi:AcrR family transcriptional regulator
MRDERQARTYETIVRVVQELLESEGYDAVQVRTVAKRARVSLATMYKFFPTVDDLIAEAVVRWMGANVYSDVAEPSPDASLYEALMWTLRVVFEPWERNPGMLEAFHRARTGPRGERLDAQGRAVVKPVARAFLDTLDPAYAEDVQEILVNAVYAVVGRFADGKLAITDLLPRLERTVYRITTDNAALAAGDRPQLRRSGNRRERGEERTR